MIDDLPAHSYVGASTMERWSTCPGSVALSKGITGTTSKYAEEGTLGHEYSAAMLGAEGVVMPDIREFPDMHDFVMVYVDYVQKLAKGNQYWIERKFHLKTVHEGAFGSADAVVFDESTKTLEVIDLKYGRGHVVEVKNNPQLKYYALGALLSEPSIRPKNIKVTIIQPRAFHEDGPIRSHTYTPLELLEFSGELLEAIRETEKPNAKLAQGDHCFFCPAKHKCPLLHKKTMELARQEFKPVEGYDKNELSRVLNAIPAIEAYIEGVRSFAYREAEQGNVAPGFKLVPKRAMRKWAVSEGEVIKKIESIFVGPIPSQCKTDPELKSVAQIEKVLGKKDFEKIKDLVVAISSGNTLVADSDKRDAVTKGSEFSVIPQQNILL